MLQRGMNVHHADGNDETLKDHGMPNNSGMRCLDDHGPAETGGKVGDPFSIADETINGTHSASTATDAATDGGTTAQSRSRNDLSASRNVKRQWRLNRGKTKHPQGRLNPKKPRNKEILHRIASESANLERIKTLLVHTDIRQGPSTYKNCITLLDTGATLTCASLDFAKSLERRGFKLKKEKSRHNDPTAAVGHKMKIAFDITVDVILRGTPDIVFSSTRISIIPGLKAELILGVDSLLDRTIQIQRRTVKIDNQINQ